MAHGYLDVLHGYPITRQGISKIPSQAVRMECQAVIVKLVTDKLCKAIAAHAHPSVIQKENRGLTFSFLNICLETRQDTRMNQWDDCIALSFGVP